METAARRVVIVGYDEAALLDIACVADAMDVANALGARPLYDVRLATRGGRPVGCRSGLVLTGHTSLEQVRGPLDTLVVVGGTGHEAASRNGALVAHVRRLAAESRRVSSVCTGTSVLAAAGLLEGRRVTTHWAFAPELAARYPGIKVDPAPLYVRDGDVYTAAGVTSALDLTLAFIEDDNGPDVARSVARGLVTYLQRPGNQAQMSMFVAAPPSNHRLVRQLVDHISGNLAGDLGAATLAGRAGVSERHLTRLFLEHLGESPARFVRAARTEAAALLLVSSPLPLTAVASNCGFGSAETLRRAFVARYGVAPSSYRAVHCRQPSPAGRVLVPAARRSAAPVASEV